jgi:hypothetical protein
MLFVGAGFSPPMPAKAGIHMKVYPAFSGQSDLRRETAF